MNGLIESIKPFIKKYGVESVIVSCAFLISVISLLLFLNEKNTKNENIVIKASQNTPDKNINIVVDVSGAVQHPFIYTFTSSARFIDAIQKAGGLTEEADKAFVARNINYARILSDQEKIYIPFLSDTANGTVGENKRIIEYLLPNTFMRSAPESKLVNINTASLLQLDQLPGVGKIQGEAIMNGKPYYSIDDLTTKNIISKATYEKIKDLISVY